MWVLNDWTDNRKCFRQQIFFHESQHPASDDRCEGVTVMVWFGASVEDRGERVWPWRYVDWVDGLLATLLVQNAGPATTHPHTHTTNLCCFLFPGGSSLVPPSQASWADSFCSSPKQTGENELPMASASMRFSLLWWPWARWVRKASHRAWSSVLLSSIWDPRQGHAAFLVCWHLRAFINIMVTLSVCRPQLKYYDLSSWAQGNLIINKVISFAGVFSNPQAWKCLDTTCQGSWAVRLIHCVKIGARGHQSPDTQISLWESHFIQTIS